MKYKEVLGKLYDMRLFGIRLGLARIGRLTRHLGWPQGKYRTIIVTGSNGKGSVATMIAEGLRAAGYRVGLYTSPHLDDFRERIVMNGKKIPEEEVVKEYEWVQKVARGMKGKSEPSFFEVVTAMALDYFSRQWADWVVLEVGLGGRMDATNIAKAEIAVITRVDMEHAHILGNSLRNIAREKAGVVKHGASVITGAEGEALDELRHLARAKMARVHVVKTPYAGKVGMLGEHQRMNAAIAAEALRHAGVKEGAIAWAIERAKVPGRVEVVGKKPLVVMDSAHNPAAMRELGRTLAQVPEFAGVKGKRVLVFGAMKDKDAGAMLREIVSLVDEVIVNEPKVERAAKAGELAKLAEKYNKRVTIVKDVGKSLAAAQKAAGKDGLVVATGSIYMLAEMRGVNELRVAM